MKNRQSDGQPAEHGAIFSDPVCWMDVDPRSPKFRHELGDTTYYFCSERCRDKFKADADRYLNPAADVLPDQKQAKVEKLKKQGRRVAMAGDGIKRRPGARCRGCRNCNGHGNRCRHGKRGDYAGEGDLRGIVHARHLSRATMRNIRQNLFFGCVYNAAGVLAAGASTLVRDTLVADHCGSGDGAELSPVIDNSLRLRGARL